jgi:hypothetical protein
LRSLEYDCNQTLFLDLTGEKLRIDKRVAPPEEAVPDKKKGGKKKM